MSDVLTQLPEYGHQLDEEASPITFVRPAPVARWGPWRERPWAVAAVAAAITVVAIGSVAWLFRGNSSAPPVADQVPETWITYTAADGIVSDCACSMTVATDGSVWVVGFDGISRFDGLQWERVELPRPFDGEGWPDVAASPDGSVWVSGMNYLTQYREGTWGPIIEAGFGADEGDPRSFQGLVVDALGRVWTGLGDRPGIIEEGLFTPADESVVSIPGYEESWGIPNTVAPDGALWFDGIRFDGDTVTEHELPGGIIGFGPDGSLWMSIGDSISGVDGALIPADGEQLTTYDLGGVRGVAFGADGTVWFLVHQVGPDAWVFGQEQWSEPGLYRLRNGKWTRITTEDGLPAYNLSVMEMGLDGALWISTSDGIITRYQPGTDPHSGASIEISSRPYDPVTDHDSEYPPITHAGS